MSWSSLFLGNSVREYVIFLGILAFGVLLGKAVSWVLQNVIRVFAKRTKNKIDDVLIDVVEGPFVLAVFIITLWLAQRVLVLSPAMQSFYGEMITVLIMVNLGWVLLRFLDSVIEHYLIPYAEASETDLDDILVPILRTIAKVLVIITLLIMVFSHFGFNVAGLIAGLGIGGVAIAFAAKDIISNVFGGVSVIADKPFKIGDTIKFGDKTGVVKEIGIRTTRLVSAEGTLLIIPNAKFTDGIIENISAKDPKPVKAVASGKPVKRQPKGRKG